MKKTYITPVIECTELACGQMISMSTHGNREDAVENGDMLSNGRGQADGIWGSSRSNSPWGDNSAAE